MNEVPEAKKKGRSGAGVLVALMALAGSAGGTAGAQILLPQPESACATPPAEPTAQAASPEAIVGHMLDLPEVVVNVQSSGLNRFLRAKVVLELIREPGQDINAVMPLLQDILLTTLSGLSVEQIEADDGRLLVKQRIKDSMDGVVGGIHRVLINDFIVQ